MDNIFLTLKNSLIVSCQAEGDSTFNSPEGVLMFAKEAIKGGAKGIRSEGFEKTKHIVANIEVAVIGLIKSKYEDGFVKITGSFDDVEKLLKTNCQIIAIDGTFRLRENLNGPKFIQEIKKKYNCIIMADVSTLEEGIACVDFGADCISTTLSGYTPNTKNIFVKEPDFNLVINLSKKVSVPVFAEGRIRNPESTVKMFDNGAWAVVVGSAITRPSVIASWFSEEIRNYLFLTKKNFNLE